MSPTKLATKPPTTVDLEKKDTTIAQELEDRLWYLADPEVVWVDHEPDRTGTACLVANAITTTYKTPYREEHYNTFAVVLSSKAISWLQRFISEYAAEWNEIDKRDYLMGYSPIRLPKAIRATDACGNPRSYIVCIDPSQWNDDFATSKEEVLLMLEEAIDQAKWEGV